MKKMKASEIRLGIIGYGGAFNMGRYHLVEAKKAGITPAAVCDLDEKRLAAAKDEFPEVETYTSISEMLKKSSVNLVAIVTPHNTHAKIAVQCLKAGVNVICEKPMAMGTAECDAMIAAAKKSKVMLSVYQSRHWDGCIMQAVKALKSKPIGDIIRIEAHMGEWSQPGNWWRSSKSISGGVLFDWGAHLLEYTFQLIESDIVEVSGFVKTGFWANKTAWKADTNEDEGFITIRYANGAWSTMSVSSIDSNPKPSVLEITGTKGTYLFDHEKWTMITHKGETTVTTKGRNMKGDWTEYYRNVAKHLSQGEELVIKPELGRRIIHVLDLGMQSAKKGKSMTPKYK